MSSISKTMSRIKRNQLIGFSNPQPFELTSGVLLVTDPCYSKSEGRGQITFDKARKGTWYSTVEYIEPDRTDIRISRILAWHESQKVKEPLFDFPLTKYEKKAIDVDSGQAGFFDQELFPGGSDTPFYDKVCDLTLQSVPPSILEEVGVLPDRLKEITDPDLLSLRESNHWDNISMYLMSLLGPDEDFNRYFRKNFKSENLPKALYKYGSLGNFGVVSSAGYGDGSYSVKSAKDDGELIAVEIIFIDENSDEPYN